MYQKEMEQLSAAAEKKWQLLCQQRLAFLMLSMLGGAFVSLGAVGMIALAQLFPEQAALAKTLGAASFPLALALVYMAGGELFTGNVMVFQAAVLRRQKTWGQAALYLTCNWVGNLLGAVLISALYRLTGLVSSQYLATLQGIVQYKTELSWLNLLTRGMLCNLLVCLAVWCAYRLQSESGKLIMTILAVFVFVIAGFEHSVANMTWLFVGQAFPLPTAQFLPICHNLLWVTLGNILGGAGLVALPYYWASAKLKLS